MKLTTRMTIDTMLERSLKADMYIVNNPYSLHRNKAYVNSLWKQTLRVKIKKNS